MGTPRVSATICAKVVSWPWPWECVPVQTITEPVGVTRTCADSTRPMPPVAGAVAAEGPNPQISIHVESPMPMYLPFFRPSSCSLRTCS